MELVYQKEISEFEEKFANMKDKKIVLYGTGRLTGTLLEGLDKSWNIVGVCDRDQTMIGKSVYGSIVLSQAEAESSADILIINTSNMYWQSIYRRIRNWDIPVYFLNGELASDKQSDYEDNLYWNKSWDELKTLADEYEIVSFDIFDTLVMRKTYTPVDVFELAGIRVKNELQLDLDFAKVRKGVRGRITEPTLNELYGEIKRDTNLPDEIIRRMMEIEIETELDALIPRKKMVDFCNDIAKKKRVFFVSDMYFTKDIIKQILEKNGIKCANDDNIFVSSEYRASKEDGSLWEHFLNSVNSKNILHIGDNAVGDDKVPREMGIDTYKILEPVEMLQNSSLKELEINAVAFENSLELGLHLANVFNDPLELGITMGHVCFDSLKAAGYSLFGSYMYNFCIWLEREVNEGGYNKIIFCARDGYIVRKVYDYYISKKDGRLTQNLYLETSRQALLPLKVTHPDDVCRVVESTPYVDGAIKFLSHHFGIELDLSDTEKLSDIEIIENSKKAIYEQIEKLRDNCIRYLSSFGIDENTLFFDGSYQGSMQYLINEALGTNMNGCYFVAQLDKENKFYNGHNMKAVFQNESDADGKQSNMFKYLMSVEAFFTSPKGMVSRYDDEARPLYEPEMKNQKAFDVRLEMLEGIYKYIDDMIELQTGMALLGDTEFSDTIYGCYMDDGFIASDIMRQSFWYDNAMMHNQENPIWG